MHLRQAAQSELRDRGSLSMLYSHLTDRNDVQSRNEASS